jgi:hypothetical protein
VCRVNWIRLFGFFVILIVSFRIRRGGGVGGVGGGVGGGGGGGGGRRSAGR